MKYKIRASFLAFVLVLATIAAISSGLARTPTAPAAPAASASDLLSILPASDAVAFFDVRRGLSEVLPNIFVGDSGELQRINAKILKIKEETGADPNLLDTMAVGMSFNESATLDPEKITVLLRGRFDASQVAADVLACVRSKRTFQPKEESHEGKTIYILEGSRHNPLTMTVIDANTLAFGNPLGVRAAIDASAGRIERADAELTGLATTRPNALAGFAGRVPSAFSRKLASKDDELGQIFSTIRIAYGSLDANATTGEMLVTLRTENAEQAQALNKKLSALKQVASMMLSQRAGKSAQGQPEVVVSAQLGEVAEDSASPQRASTTLPFPPKLLKDAKITTQSYEVQISLEQILAELAPMVRSF